MTMASSSISSGSLERAVYLHHARKRAQTRRGLRAPSWAWEVMETSTYIGPASAVRPATSRTTMRRRPPPINSRSSQAAKVRLTV